MTLNSEALEVRFKGCPFGVSARRIHEHMTLGQINPFARPLASVRSPRDAAELIDLVRFDAGEWYSLKGLTLAALEDKGLDAAAFGGSLRAARRARRCWTEGAWRGGEGASARGPKPHAKLDGSQAQVVPPVAITAIAQEVRCLADSHETAISE